MARKMADPEFRNRQWLTRYNEHIAPINEYVDELCRLDHGWAPYVAPLYGGINAKLLSVLRDPGPMTQTNGGSGFLCVENDDATAEAIGELFSSAGIDMSDVLPWNAYPWYINRAPKAAELDAGVIPLRHIIDLLPNLKVVMLHGGSAHNSWKRLIRRYPNIMSEKKIHVISTYHTSRQAFWHRDPEVRESRKKHLHRAFKEASYHLQLP